MTPLKTHCKNGHEFIPENTKIRVRKDRKNPIRECIACAIVAKQRWLERHPEKRKVVAKQWNSRNVEYFKDKSRETMLRNDYDLTLEEYDAMYAAQGGVCAICNQPETTRSKKGTLHNLAVDHNHATNKVRALLCRKCNGGLGQFLDDPALLEKAAKYLRKHSEIAELEMLVTA